MKRKRETSVSECEGRAGEPQASKRMKTDFDGARQKSAALPRKKAGKKTNIRRRRPAKSEKSIGRSRSSTIARSDDDKTKAVEDDDDDIEEMQIEDDSDHPEVFSMGANDSGQMGLPSANTGTNRPTLVKFNTGNASIQVVIAGGMHSLFLSSDGEIYACGNNDNGALGTRPFRDHIFVPKTIGFQHTVLKMSSGDNHSAAVTSDGELYVWGEFRHSRSAGGGEEPFGLVIKPDGQLQKKSLIPIKVDMEERVTDVCSGLDHLACLTESGRVYTIGSPVAGRLGRIPPNFYGTMPRIGIKLWLSPLRVQFPTKPSQSSRSGNTLKSSAEPLMAKIWATNYCTFSKTREINGKEFIYAWGDNKYSQLGLRDTADRPFPQRALEFETALRNRTSDKSYNRAAGQLRWAEIVGGTGHVLALDSQGTIYGMGRREYGQLGDGDSSTGNNNPKLEPIQALLKHQFVSISACDDTSMAVTTTGHLYVWGSNTSDQLGPQSDTISLPIRIQGALKDRKVLQASVGGQHSHMLVGPPSS